nr:MAG TPA: hypothetical protein [Caudoviricetes sp.]
MEKLVNFVVEDIKQIQFDDYSEDEYAIAKVGFMSNRPNSHKLEISEDVLRENASTVLGKWMVVKMDFMGLDAEGHDPHEHIVGFFPKDQDVEFVEDEDGYIRAYATAVISKIYAKDYCKMFDSDNERAVSIEMTCHTENGKDMDDKVLSFTIVGVTTLGKAVRPSIPESDVSFVRFSQEKATAYFSELNEHNLTPLKKFAKERIASMAKTYKIDKSKEAMSDKAWGEVDKTAMRNKIMEADNKTTLVKAVYMLVENGWEEAPSEHLKYPVMELKGDTFVYNRDGLASALGYAKKENETTVVNKIEKIYKKLDLDDNEGGKEEKMAEIEFSAVNIGDLWSRLWHEIDETRHWEYSIDGVFEEDNKKFAVLRDGSGKLYRLDFSLTEDGMTVADEVIEVKQDFIDTDNIRKFSEPENVEQYQKFAEVEPEKEEMSLEEAMDKIANLESEIEKRDNIIMENEKSMKEKDIELSDLRTFKQTCMEAERGSKVEAVMSEVSKFMDKAQAEESRKEGLTCEFSAVDAWANKVKASVFDKMSKASTKEGDFTRMSAPVEIKKTGSVWDRL